MKTRFASLLLCALGVFLPSVTLSSQEKTPKKPPTFAELVEDFQEERKLPFKGRTRTISRILIHKGPKLVEFLITELQGNETASVERMLARAFAKHLDHEKAAAALPKIWPELRVSSRQALCTGLRIPVPAVPREFFSNLYKGGKVDLQVKRYLVKPLALPISNETMPFLKQLIESEDDSLLVRNAIQCLAQVPDSPVKKALLEYVLGLSNPLVVAAGIKVLPFADLPWFRKQMSKLLNNELVSYIRPRAYVAEPMAMRLAAVPGVKTLTLFLDLVASRPKGGISVFLELAPCFKSDPCRDYWLQNGLRSKDEVLLQVTLRGLTAFSEKRVARAVKKLLRHRQPRIRQAAIRALAEIEKTGSIQSLERIAANGKQLEDRIEAIDALHRIRKGESAWIPELLGFYRSRHVAIKARALDLLAELNAAEVFEQIKRAANYRHWIIRSAFYNYVGKTREPQAIPLLINALEKETGRLKSDAEKALNRIAGISFQFNVGRWRKWWEAEKVGFKPPPLKTKKGTLRNSTKYANTYYGIPVVSERLCFLLDISGSMVAKTGTGGETRLALAKDSLTQVLVNFREDTCFNMIFFQNILQVWENTLTPATQDNRRRALSYVRRQRPIGGTNICGALEKAYEDKGVDTLYLLSDGTPTVGRITDSGRLLTEVLAWNRVRRITIHCISLGGPSKFLEQLAAQTGGQYVIRNR